MCTRCGGAGRSDKWAHTGFTCYDCKGARTRGIETVKLYTAEKLAKLTAAKAKADAKRTAIAQDKADARAAEAAAKAEGFQAANADLLRLAAGHMDNEFIADVVTRAIQRSEITDAQAAAVMAAIERIDTRKAVAAASPPVGRIGEKIETTVTVERASVFMRPAFIAPCITETVRVITIRYAVGHALLNRSPACHLPP